jgi:hypothetical protein
MLSVLDLNRMLLTGRAHCEASKKWLRVQQPEPSVVTPAAGEGERASKIAAIRVLIAPFRRVKGSSHKAPINTPARARLLILTRRLHVSSEP